MNIYLGRLGRLLLGEEQYEMRRAQILRYIRGDNEKKYARRRNEFFKSSRTKEEYQNLYRARITHLVPADQSMVLISQAARSGGTLMKRLFDNHPQCHIYPVELAMGIKPDIYEYAWPKLDLTDEPDTWLKSLMQIHVWRWLKEDFRYWSKDKETHPFIFLPILCRQIFLRCVSERTIREERDIFDCYMTAFFNAWIDNQNLYSTSRKKRIIAFAPIMGLKRSNIDRFFTVYPNGTYISIIRDPRNWYASALRYRQWEYGDLDTSMQIHWNKSTKEALDIWHDRPEKVVLIGFEELIQNTEQIMLQLARRLDIEYTGSMLTPTFNGRTIKANSSFKGKREITNVTLNRFEKVLTPQEISRIEQHSKALYEVAIQAIQDQDSYMV